MSDTMTNDNPLYQELKKIIEEKKKLQNPLIEILHKAQELFGYLPMEVQVFIANEMDIPVSKIFGVVTFYNAFTMKPRGKYVINVCEGTACFVKGAKRLISMISDELGIQMGETTPDKKFTMTSVRCVGACSLAPVFVIGEDTYGRVDTRDKIKTILKKYIESE
jgi:NADH:ubiquinone oxidoreductase subunit E